MAEGYCKIDKCRCVSEVTLCPNWVTPSNSVPTERLARSVLIMVKKFNVPTDVLDLIVNGDVSRGVPPGALLAAIREY